MEDSKKRCAYCGGLFVPDPRIGKKQKRCFSLGCRRASNRKKVRKWRKLHPDHGYSAKVRAWAKAYPNYWKQYRKGHPDYVKKDNQRRAQSMKRQRRSANVTSIRSIAVAKLERIESLNPVNCSANVTLIDRRVDELIEYLFWAVRGSCSANVTSNDLGLILR